MTTPRLGMDASARRLLERLHAHGATRLRTVALRPNRSTLWSLTRRGRMLNLHRAYAAAPESVVAAFALLARTGGRGGSEVQEAAQVVRSWPPVLEAVGRLRRKAVEARRRNPSRAAASCAGTPEQRALLREGYQHLNRCRFDGRLPGAMALRWSRRMRRSLGHLRRLPDTDEGRAVEEIALNLDLLLADNEALLRDTLLHEMAHVAAWIFDGDPGHGRAWRRWARRVGCSDRRCHEGTWRGRSPRSAQVLRVPPWTAVFPTG